MKTVQSLEARSAYRDRALCHAIRIRNGEKIENIENIELITNKNIFSLLINSTNHEFSENVENYDYTLPLDISLLIVNNLVGRIPVLGSILNIMISSFWPSSTKSIWDEIKDQIQQLINESLDRNTWNMLSAKINELREKVFIWQNLIDNEKWSEAISLYHFISNYLIGMEQNFKVKGASVEQAFTPLFVAMVDFILSFRINIVLNYKDFHLTEQNSNHERNLIRRLVIGSNGAAQYIREEQQKYYDKFMKDAEKFNLDARPPRIFDNASMEYGFLTRCGLTKERADLWEERANHLVRKKYIDIDVIIPSVILGDFNGEFRNGAELYKKLFTHTKENGFNHIRTFNLASRKQYFSYSKRRVERECLVQTISHYESQKKIESPKPNPKPSHNYSFIMNEAQQIHHTYIGLIYNTSVIYPCHLENLGGGEIKTDFPSLVPGETGAFVRMKTDGTYVLRAINVIYSEYYRYIQKYISCFAYNNEAARNIDVKGINSLVSKLYEP